MKALNINKMTQEVNENGYSFVEGFLSQGEIETIQTLRDAILHEYNTEKVKDRLFYLREESGNKQGDAVMVSLEPNKELPSMVLGRNILGKLLQNYNALVTSLTGVKVPKSSRAMLNSQQYFEKSRFVEDHYDGEFFEFTHDHDDTHNEDRLLINKGLIPRYVIVFVLHNNNENGHGTYIRMHDSDERIHVNAFAGDMFIFDNSAVRHGVPSLEKDRSMIGFRNFDHMPYYFEAEPEGGNDWIEMPDTFNPGWVREICSLEAVELMKSFNEKWTNELAEEQIKKPAAF